MTHAIFFQTYFHPEVNTQFLIGIMHLAKVCSRFAKKMYIVELHTCLQTTLASSWNTLKPAKLLASQSQFYES